MLDTDISKLEWKCCYTCEGITVVKTKPMAPLHMHVVGVELTGNIAFRMPGHHTDLLKYQSSVGFAGVPESALKMLLESDEVGTPDVLPVFTDEPEADICTMTLMKLLEPSMTAERALQIMLTKKAVEDTQGASYVDDLTDDAVQDVILHGDAKEHRCHSYMPSVQSVVHGVSPSL